MSYCEGRPNGVSHAHAQKDNNNIDHLAQDATKDPMAVKVHHALAQPDSYNPCVKNNGHCEHMCILTARTDEEGLGYKCACKIGYKLNK